MDRYTNLVENSSTKDDKITNSNYSSSEISRGSIEKKDLDAIIQVNQDFTSKEKKQFRERCIEIIQMEINSESNSKLKDKENAYREEEVIYCRNIHKTYLIGLEGVPALRGVSLKVKRGEFLIILGTSGGGKNKKNF